MKTSLHAALAASVAAVCPQIVCLEHGMQRATHRLADLPDDLLKEIRHEVLVNRQPALLERQRVRVFLGPLPQSRVHSLQHARAPTLPIAPAHQALTHRDFVSEAVELKAEALQGLRICRAAEGPLGGGGALVSPLRARPSAGTF
jgi:hypothetical protein